GVVVVERERPAKLLGGSSRLRSDGHRAVARLPRSGDCSTAARLDEALSHPPRGVAGEPRRSCERVRPTGTDGDFDHVREPTGLLGHDRKSVLRLPGPPPTVGRMARPVTPVDFLIAVSLIAAVVVLFAHGHAHRTTA